MERLRSFADECFVSFPGQTILIADNEPAIFDVLGPKLLRAGFQVLSAQDGAAALLLAKLRLPSLILLDQCMPAMTGIEVSERLCERPATAEIPVILLTGLPIQSCVPPNVREIVTKPFQAKAIIETIQEILAKSAVA